MIVQLIIGVIKTDNCSFYHWQSFMLFAILSIKEDVWLVRLFMFLFSLRK